MDPNSSSTTSTHLLKGANTNTMPLNSLTPYTSAATTATTPPSLLPTGASLTTLNAPILDNSTLSSQSCLEPTISGSASQAVMSVYTLSEETEMESSTDCM
uniref:Uncharacterized protein n=1 Tax=Bactrocera dorsalis TaxID=27457 RepID=A0A034WWU9_BACDO